jgi:hypothetical protein
MILSAMMFALGVFVTGLLSLGFCVALVRRTRRVTERRILTAISARRAEFDAERDELRARHAIQMHRLEREVARVLDMATAHRLEADVKDRDLLNLRAEMQAQAEEARELQERFEEQRVALQEFERKSAESGTSLRASRHALKLESKRRTAIEDSLDHALATVEQQQIEIAALKSRLASLAGEAEFSQDESGDAILAKANGSPVLPKASVIPLPLRLRTAAPEEIDVSPETKHAPHEANGAHWTGTDAAALPEADAWRVSAEEAEADPEAVEHANGFDANGKAPDEAAAPAPQGKQAADPESLFVEALAEIRALKRAANSPAE